MSNSQVGQVYQQIIQDVIEASRTDFEEGGIDENVLDELKKGWQKKLSQQQLAVFPWDPKPEPPPAPAAAAPGPQPVPVPASSPPIAANGATHAQHPAASAPGLSLPTPSSDAHVKAEPLVKTEPGLENTLTMPQGTGAQDVQHRVIHKLQTKYGDRAAGSIDKLKAGMAQQPNQARPAGQPIPPNYPGQYQGTPQQMYRQNMPQNPAAQQSMPNNQRPNPSQMDGAAGEEHEGVLMRYSSAGQMTELGRVQIDNLLHAQIEARAKAMEGGGLMLPLKRTGTGKPSSSSSRRRTASAGGAQFDGPDDDLKDDEEEEVDEDAINSDLDDPDDNVEDDDEDEDGGQIMLCMYDKVQRVKNKW
jgi:transcription initiation factor TFIIA large subunit